MIRRKLRQSLAFVGSLAAAIAAGVWSEPYLPAVSSAAGLLQAAVAAVTLDLLWPKGR